MKNTQTAYFPDGKSFPTYWAPDRLHIGLRWYSYGAAVVLHYLNDVEVEIVEMSEDKKEIWVELIS